MSKFQKTESNDFFKNFLFYFNSFDFLIKYFNSQSNVLIALDLTEQLKLSFKNQRPFNH